MSSKRPEDEENLTDSEVLAALHVYDDCLSERERQWVSNILQRSNSGAHVSESVMWDLRMIWEDIDYLRQGPDGIEWDLDFDEG